MTDANDICSYNGLAGYHSGVDNNKLPECVADRGTNYERIGASGASTESDRSDRGSVIGTM